MSADDGDNFADIYEPMTPDYEPIQNYHLVDQVVGELTSLVTELESVLPSLPTVTPDGRSECPFARDMYRRKNKLEAKVGEKVGVLRGMSKDVENEIARCERNLSRLGVDKRKLHSEITKGNYQGVMDLQEREYAEVLDTRKKLVAAVQRADSTLAASRRETFPGADFEGEAEPLDVSATTDPYPTGDSVRDDIGGLLNLGVM